MYVDVEDPSILTSFDIFLSMHVGNSQKYMRFGCTVNVPLHNSNTFDYIISKKYIVLYENRHWFTALSM